MGTNNNSQNLDGEKLENGIPLDETDDGGHEIISFFCAKLIYNWISSANSKCF